GEENRGYLAAEVLGQWTWVASHRDDSDRHRHDQIRRGRMGYLACYFLFYLSMHFRPRPLRSSAARAQTPRRYASDIPFQPNLKEPVPPKHPTAPTAAIIVRDFDGVAVHALLTIPRLFPNHFKNVVFISVGVIDSGQFKGQKEIENLRRAKEEDLKSFVEFANC